MMMSQQTWAANVARFEAAFAQWERFREEVFDKADEAAVKNKTDVSSDIDEEESRLSAAWSNAMLHVLDTPAPDQAALRWKLDCVLAGAVDGLRPSLDEPELRQVIADYRRLLGGQSERSETHAAPAG